MGLPVSTCRSSLHGTRRPLSGPPPHSCHRAPFVPFVQGVKVGAIGMNGWVAASGNCARSSDCPSAPSRAECAGEGPCHEIAAHSTSRCRSGISAA